MTGLIQNSLYTLGTLALGGTLYKSITQPEKSTFETPVARACMHLSITAFVYVSGLHNVVGTGKNLDYLATLITLAGGAFGAMRVADNILNEKKRFDSLIGRLSESAVSLGVAIATLHAGSLCNISFFDTLSYTATGLSSGAKYALIGSAKIGGLVAKAAFSRLIGA